MVELTLKYIFQEIFNYLQSLKNIIIILALCDYWNCKTILLYNYLNPQYLNI